MSANELFDLVTNNQNWEYRSDLKKLNILTNKNGFETWEEISKDGNVIQFRVKEKKTYSFYSFEMENSIMTGYWEAEFEELAHGKTQFKATEYIRMKNPFLKVISYLSFDIGKFMDTYQNDLHKEIKTKSIKE